MIFDLINIPAGLALLVLLTVVAKKQWYTMRPSAKLFTMAFGLYILVAFVGSVFSFLSGASSVLLLLRGAVLLIANVWLFVATYALHREWLQSNGNRKKGNP